PLAPGGVEVDHLQPERGERITLDSPVIARGWLQTGDQVGVQQIPFGSNRGGEAAGPDGIEGAGGVTDYDAHGRSILLMLQLTNLATNKIGQMRAPKTWDAIRSLGSRSTLHMKTPPAPLT